MTTSQTPWSTRPLGTQTAVLNATGDQIAVFNDWRDADIAVEAANQDAVRSLSQCRVDLAESVKEADEMADRLAELQSKLKAIESAVNA